MRPRHYFRTGSPGELQISSELKLRPFQLIITECEIAPVKLWGEFGRPGPMPEARELRIVATVLDAKTGEETPIFFLSRVPQELPESALAWWVRDELVRVCTHEVDECLRHADNSHVHNPHPPGLQHE